MHEEEQEALGLIMATYQLWYVFVKKKKNITRYNDFVVSYYAKKNYKAPAVTILPDSRKRYQKPFQYPGGGGGGATRK